MGGKKSTYKKGYSGTKRKAAKKIVVTVPKRKGSRKKSYPKNALGRATNRQLFTEEQLAQKTTIYRARRDRGETVVMAEGSYCSTKDGRAIDYVEVGERALYKAEVSYRFLDNTILPDPEFVRVADPEKFFQGAPYPKDPYYDLTRRGLREQEMARKGSKEALLEFYQFETPGVFEEPVLLKENGQPVLSFEDFILLEELEFNRMTDEELAEEF